MSRPKKNKNASRATRQPPKPLDGNYPVSASSMTDDELIKHCTQLLRCDTCGNGKATMRCSRCHLVHYCSRECQVKAWKQEHKSECEPISVLKKELQPFRVHCQLSSTNVEDNEQKERQVLEAEPKCAICFEQPMVKPVVLEKCHHAFCFPCLRSWNASHQATQPRLGFGPSSGTTPTSTALTCPLCRQVIPNMAETVWNDIKLLLYSAQGVNASKSFVQEQCTKALSKME